LGAKLTSKGLAWFGAKQTRISKCLVLGVVQRFGALCGCKVWVPSKQTKQRFGVLCGFPVKKGISVRTKNQAVRAGCGQFRVRCCAGAVPSKQAKQTSKQKLGA